MSAAARPDALQAWIDLCELVDTSRVAINRDLQNEVGLTLAENLVLCHVAMAPNARMRMVDLAEQLNVAKSAITKTVDRLESRGLLERGRDGQDRRSVLATLTARGRRTFAKAQPAFVNSVDRHFGGRLDVKSMRALHDVISRVGSG